MHHQLNRYPEAVIFLALEMGEASLVFMSEKYDISDVLSHGVGLAHEMNKALFEKDADRVVKHLVEYMKLQGMEASWDLVARIPIRSNNLSTSRTTPDQIGEVKGG